MSTPTDDGIDDWIRPRPGPAGYRRDAIVAGALAVAAWLSWFLYAGAIDQPHAPWWGAAIWAVLIAGPLAFRHRYPVLVALVVTATFVIGQNLAVWEQLFANICLFLAVYSVGAWSTNRLLARVVRILITVGMVMWLIGLYLVQALNPENIPGSSEEGWLSQFTALGAIQLVTNLLYFGAAYVFGNAAYASARQREALERRTLELEREREVSSRQAVELERVRIARELHDVVAHHVSVMGLQAGAARRVLAKSDADPRAIESLTLIEGNAREAVDELHRMLGALRRPGEPVPETDEASRSASTRGVAQLDELVAEARATGLPVTFSTVGEPQPVPPGVGLSLYRIAQESLTNVRKHGGPRATADVRLRYLHDTVEIEIGDTGAGAAVATPTTASSSGTGIGSASASASASRTASASASASPIPGAGLGQIGMRERVAAVGGEIEIGPKPRGGYRVRARLPLAGISTRGTAS
ncbi:sensor histidine kinase [Herbiconiux sp. P15]|uniref:sensor histidine kinase n=1 Tax=Herbiconiux liukaitaii TaxID=3342799 RepID=UPI0035B93861